MSPVDAMAVRPSIGVVSIHCRCLACSSLSRLSSAIRYGPATHGLCKVFSGIRRHGHGALVRRSIGNHSSMRGRPSQAGILRWLSEGVRGRYRVASYRSGRLIHRSWVHGERLRAVWVRIQCRTTRHHRTLREGSLIARRWRTARVKALRLAVWDSIRTNGLWQVLRGSSLLGHRLPILLLLLLLRVAIRTI